MEADALRQQNRSMGKPVRFLGICEDHPVFYERLNVFVLCSDFEGAGISVMEAMAAGIPVVATRVGGLEGIVQEGETGLLVPPGDVAALEDAVWTLLQDEEACARMGMTARAYAQAHFSADRMISELDALYNELLS